MSEADAAALKEGSKVRVDRKGDGKYVVATVVKQTAAGASAGGADDGAASASVSLSWDVRYDDDGEGGEVDTGVDITRIKERLVHEWAHSSYANGAVDSLA